MGSNRGMQILDKACQHRWFLWPIQIAGIALLYFALGRLAQLLSIPPGNVMPVWPPAGLALAAGLVLGARVWPGIWLGSFLFNIWVFVNVIHVADLSVAVACSSVIGAGAAIQALAGVWLIHRSIAHFGAVDRSKAFFMLMILGGPISCLVNATISLMSLFISGYVDWDTAAIVWGTWWTGDVAGVLIVMPLVYLWILRVHRPRIRVLFATTIILCGFVFAITLLFIQVRSWESQRSKATFNQQAAAVEGAIHERLSHSIESLHFIRSFYAGSKYVDRNEFKRFVQDSLVRRQALMCLAWVPRVSHDQRKAYEDDARKAGHAHFRIRDRIDLTKNVPFEVRPQYYPVHYVEPSQGYYDALGLDLGDDPACRAAMDQARDTGTLATSTQHALAQPLFGGRIILTFLPIYRNQASITTIKDRRQELIGFATSVLSVKKVVTECLSNLNLSHLKVCVNDNADLNSSCLIDDKVPSEGCAFVSPSQPIGEHRDGLVWNTVLDVGGGQLGLFVQPSAGYGALHQPWEAWAILLGCVLFGGMLGSFLVQTMTHAVRVERLVMERTSDLKQSKSELEMEIVHREKLGTLLDLTQATAQVGGWEIDLATDELHWTDETYRIHEIPLGTPVTVKEAITFYHPDSRPIITEAVGRCIQDGDPYDLELQFITAKQRLIWVRALGRADYHDGEIVRVNGAFQDITHQKHAEQERERLLNLEQTAHAQAEQAKQRITDILESITDAFVALDRDWQYTYVNQRAAAIFNRSREELIGTNIWAEFSEGVDKPFYHAYQEAMARQEPMHLVEYYSPWDRWFENHIYPTSKGISVFFSDVTDRKHAEMELEEAKSRSEAANQAKTEFLANMSHEIRTPMTAILGFADLLYEDAADSKAPSHRIDAIQTIRHNGEHLLTILNDILDLSKIEAGKMTVERVECSPGDIASDVISLFQSRAQGKKLSLEIETVGDIPKTIQSDPTRLRQILTNLVGNAIKFTESGSVRLVIRMVDRSNTDDALLGFEVVDTGIGMTEDQMKRLFQSFSQADNTTTRKFGGTGLGLMISRRLTEMLGGDITVHSALGKGSSFLMTVSTGPLAGQEKVTSLKRDDNSDRKHLISESSTTMGIHGRILLAEDSPEIQRLVAFVLKKEGADVTVAENGRIACEKATSAWKDGSPFDVILMDMQMPELDGYGATAKLRERGYKGAIIALTAHAMAADRQKCLDAGCDDYATKPIDKAKLLKIVKRYTSNELEASS